MLWNGNRTHDKLEKWESNPWILIQNGNWTQGNCLKSGKLNPCICLQLGIEPMTCWCCELEQKSLFPKFSSESMTKRCEFKLYHWLNMRIEPRTYSSVKSKPYPRCPKGTRTHDYVARLTRSNINVRIWESNPWIMFCETKYWSIWLKYF
jgi:hypothetical protein